MHKLQTQSKYKLQAQSTNKHKAQTYTNKKNEHYVQIHHTDHNHKTYTSRNANKNAEYKYNAQTPRKNIM